MWNISFFIHFVALYTKQNADVLVCKIFPFIFCEWCNLLNLHTIVEVSWQILAYMVTKFHMKSNGEHNVEPSRSFQNTEISITDILRKTQKYWRLDMFEHTFAIIMVKSVPMVHIYVSRPKIFICLISMFGLYDVLNNTQF